MPDGDPKQGSAFDEERLERLVELMKEHGLSELELRDADQEVRLSRVSSGNASAAAPPPAASATPAAPAATSSAPTESDSIKLITSPMVGTFYSKPNPNAPSFVKVGDHVEEETTVCIIEAMKVFNEIPAEVRGKVVAVLVDDEEAVEFGKPLFKVDTQG